MVRRWLLVAVAALALAGGGPGARPAAAAEPTSDDLALLALTLGDLPAGFLLVFDQPGNVTIPPFDVAGYQAAFQGADGGQSLQLSLFGFPNTVSDDFVQSLFDGFTAGFGETTPADAPALGQFARRAVQPAPADDPRASAELLIWRQGPVVALLICVGFTPDQAQALARTQQARLAVAFADTPAARAPLATAAE